MKLISANIKSRVLGILLSCLFIFPISGKSQSSLHGQVLSYLKETHPTINTDNLLIALNVWSPDDMNSREANLAFEKAMTTFRYAKLKGGTGGFIVVTICKQGDETQARILLNKDGATGVYVLPSSLFNKDTLPLKNTVMNASGEEVYKDLETKSTFSSIHQLITR